MKLINREKGFTLIELLLVVVIIGLLLAVIVPRAWRANIDTKYGLVRQNCAELTSYAQQWAEKSLQAQDDAPGTSTSTIADYYASLAGWPGGFAGSAGWAFTTWIASAATSNWTATGATGRVPVPGRMIEGVADTSPEDAVENHVPVDKMTRNPFNGMQVFASPQNDPTAAGNSIPGAIACGGNGETSGWLYLALLFQGTDSTTTTVGGAAPTTSFHEGQDVTLAGLRNGIFLGRVK